MELSKTQQEQFEKDSQRVYDVFQMSYGRHALGAFWKHLDEHPTWTVMELLAYLNDEDEEAREVISGFIEKEVSWWN